MPMPMFDLYYIFSVNQRLIVVICCEMYVANIIRLLCICLLIIIHIKALIIIHIKALLNNCSNTLNL